MAGGTLLVGREILGRPIEAPNVAAALLARVPVARGREVRPSRGAGVAGHAACGQRPRSGRAGGTEMKRDVRLHGLTSDHHHALVLALRIKEATARGDLGPALVRDARRRYDEDLRAHFAVEEEELLPALVRAGRQDLVERTLADHLALHEHLCAAEAGDLRRLSEFGARLEAHVRFEERELFPACEALVEAEVLARVAHRAPKPNIRRWGADS